MIVIVRFIRFFLSGEPLSLTLERFFINQQLLVVQLYNIAFYAPNNFSNGPSLRFICYPTFYNTWPMLSLFAVMADLK